MQENSSFNNNSGPTADNTAADETNRNAKSSPTDNAVPGLLALLGADAVLLSIPHGKKCPTDKNWQRRTIRAMSMPRYLKRLANGNIGVLQGLPSKGLCSIDIDAEGGINSFLELNPALKQTLHSRGARECNIWLRITGDYPKVTKISHRDGKAWGEWRSTGGQTVIFGRHPSDCDYQITNEVKPLEVAFNSIVWPDELKLPWGSTVYTELVREHGEPFVYSKNSVRLNDYFFVAKFEKEHLVIYEPDEGQFYKYKSERGLWLPETDAAIKDRFALDLKSYADSQSEPQIIEQRTNSLLTGYAAMLKGRVEKKEIFKRRHGVIHLGNGMLHLDVNPPELRAYSPEYFSRNQCPISLVEGADCPRFKNELLASALDEDDVSLLQRYLGSLLLGGNPAQRLLLLTGTPGGGKSSLAEIAESIIGEENVAELRTELLSERFEIGRYLGKTLLTGKDVPPEFLMRKGASNIKKMVGHDLLSAERKQSNSCFNLRGEFAILITCNTRLRVMLEGDADAWRRRLLIIDYNRPKPKVRISEFAKKLQREEGPGILNWMIEGAVLHLRELDNGGDFILSVVQNERVETLLAESDSLREFVRKWLHTSKNDVTVEELVQGYEFFCAEMDYHPISGHLVATKLPDLIAEIHGLTKRHDIDRDEGQKRGFKGLEVWRNK